VVDHGIGQPDHEVDEQTAYEGRLVQRQVSELCQTRSMPKPWALLLFSLIREFQPEHCVELGACMGISSSFQVSALERNHRGSLVTIEGDKELANIARETLLGLELRRGEVVVGRFQDRLEDVLKRQSPLDFAFIDGHHERHATVQYFEQTLSVARDGAVLVFDDIHWSKGMSRAWTEIQRHPRVRLAIDLRKLGVCVLGENPAPDSAIRVDIA
jgi:predicted O-methyltransferase YrrM